MAEIVPDKELNCRGMRCPLPVIYTRKALVPMSPGEILKVISTDPGAVTDISEFSRRTSTILLAHEEDAGEYIFFLRKP